MMKNNRSRRDTVISTEKVNDYIVPKVINWILKDKVDKGNKSSFKWSEQDKKVLRKTLLEPDGEANLNPVFDKKLHRFISSIIENGLNTDDVAMFQRYKDKLPLRALGLAYGLEDFDIDENKIASTKSIVAGYYMLEILIKTKKYNSQLPIAVTIEDSKNNEKMQMTHSLSMTAKSETLAKRLIWLDRDSRITITGGSVWDAQDITFLKFAKLTKNFFVSRMLKKLGKTYSMQRYENINKLELDTLWAQYQLAVNPNTDPVEKYHYFVNQQESKLIPSQKRQLSNLLKWMTNR